MGWDPYEQINCLLARPDFYALFVGTGIQEMFSGKDYQGKRETGMICTDLSYRAQAA